MSLVKTNSFQLAIYSQGNPNSEKLALVLPGKLDTKDYSHMRSHVDYLAKMGYFALSFDPPGTWESPGDIKLYTMTNYLKAINELINYYGNKPTLVMGHSRGGSMAIIAGATNPHITSFVSIMSSYSRGAFQEKDNNWEEKGYIIAMRDFPPGGGAEEKGFELPYSFFEDQMKYDLTENVLSSIKPKLFFLGKHDTLVYPRTIRKTYELFANPKAIYELDSDHDYRFNEKLIEEVNTVLGEFLNKYSQE